MKKLLLTSIACIGIAQAFAQCEIAVTAADTLICPGTEVTLVASGPESPLTTTFAAGNNHRGNMFDIVALNQVTIETFDAHPMGTTDIAIYYKVGSFVGFEANPGAWTLVGTANGVVSMGTGVPTPIPIPIGVTIPAGQTYGFYVTSTNTAVSLNYSNGTSAGSVYTSDANIQFLEGAGMEYPFCGGAAPFSPRIWNGVIHYSMGTTYSWSTGETTASISVAPTSPTTYSCAVTPLGCPTASDSVFINMLTAPVVDLGADTSACPGAMVTLDAGNPGNTYSWNGGVFTTQTVNVFTGVTYNVAVTNSDGCVGYDTITVAVLPNPDVNLGPDTLVCDGEIVTVDAGNTGSSYVWSNGDTTQTTNVGAGNYNVQVTDTNGCTGNDNIAISWQPLPVVSVGPDTTICINHSVVVEADPGFSTYLWSTSETTSSITLNGATLGTGTHNISVTVEDSIGCAGTDDMALTVDACLGLPGEEFPYANVFPNPASESIQVSVSNWTDALNLKIYSLDGKLVITDIMDESSAKIDLFDLDAGTYLLELSSQDGKVTTQFVKQ